MLNIKIKIISITMLTEFTIDGREMKVVGFFLGGGSRTIKNRQCAGELTRSTYVS